MGGEPRIVVEADEDIICHGGRFLQLIGRPFRNTQTGQTGTWEFVHRTAPGRIVAIVPVTPAREVVLLKSFRVPVNSYVIEFCAGLADKDGEDEAELATRELLEETGYKCENTRLAMAGLVSAGLTADEMAIYIGDGAVKVAEPTLEYTEDIETLVVPIEDLRTFLSNPPDGLLVDLKLWAIPGLFFA